MSVGAVSCGQTLRQRLTTSVLRRLGRLNHHHKNSFDLDEITLNYEKYVTNATISRSSASDDGEFRIVLPPPNITGKLHLGHALTVTVEDTLCRYHRMMGRKVEWIPGFDHAGIATQVIVEKQLWKERKLLRNQIPHSEFLELCNKWKDRSINEVSAQLKMLGATLDWSQQYFTMNEKFARAVTHAFCKLHLMGCIYRDKRFITWCPALRSSISDQEVEVINISGVQNIVIPSVESGKRTIRAGALHLIRYRLVDPKPNEKSFVEVATTRPETIFADVAIAVHPNDENNNYLIGEFVRHPLLPDRVMPIIADEMVKPEKGSGLLKVTPAHNPIDFRIAERNGNILGEFTINRCIGDDGRLTNSNEFDGIDRFDARNIIIDRLITLGLYGREVSNPSGSIRICTRSGDVVEHVIKEQWFMRCDEMNADILDALSHDHLVISPEYLRSHLEEWLNNKEPWCLSRQLVWGHRIPAYRCTGSNRKWFVAETVEEAISKIYLGKPRHLMEEYALEQETDVLDTWFSSSLIPLVVCGWPNNTTSLKPLSILETGHDIIGFWVARMLTVCHSLTGELPFRKIMLHGLIKDSTGKKMSKSRGNVINPDDVINGISLEAMIRRIGESTLSDTDKRTAVSDLKTTFPNGILKCGTDALRFALLRHNISVLNINVNIIEKATEGLRFCNKLWNLCSYAERVWLSALQISSITRSVPLTDSWIKSRLASTFRIFNSEIASSPHVALSAVHAFILSDLCDTYLETTKKALWSNDQTRLFEIAQVLREVIEKSLLLLSAFMPFVSELLYDRINGDGRSIYERHMDLKNYDEFCGSIDSTLESNMSATLAIVAALRSVRQEFQFSKNDCFRVNVYTDTHNVESLGFVVSDLCNSDAISQQPFASAVFDHFLPVAVPDYEIALGIQLKDDLSAHFHERICKQLHKADERRKKILDQMSQCKKFAESGRGTSWKKNEGNLRKKEEHIASSLRAVDNKISRIKTIINLTLKK